MRNKPNWKELIRPFISQTRSDGQRRRRLRERPNNIIFALKGLAVHQDRYTIMEINDRAIALLEKYLTTNPVDTILALVGKDTFTEDEVVDAFYECLFHQCLLLSDNFIEIDEGNWILKKI